MKTPSLLLTSLLAVSAAEAKTPVSPGASAATRRLVDRIERLHAAGYTLSGQQIGFTPWVADAANPPQVNEYTRVRQLTGKRPAILAIDINTCFNHPDRRGGLMRLAKAHAAAGGIVSLSWHEAKPTQDNPDAGDPNSSYSSLTAGEWNSLVNFNFTQIFFNWRDHLHFASGFIRELGNANVPVLWRPYHEPEGGWFWWGQTAENTPANYRLLWQRMFERFTDPGDYNLNNLIWVYSAAFPGQAPTFPGTAYVDFAGIDFYTSNPSDPLFVSRDQTVKGFGARPTALTETGLLPSPSILYPGGKQARYAWAVVWYGGDLDNTYYGAAPSGTSGNSPAQVRAFYAHPRTVDLDSIWNILERRPSLRILGPKRITTRAASHRVRAKVGAIPITPTVEYRATRTAPRKVATKSNGTANFRVKLVRPNTVVRVRAISSSKTPSKWTVLRIRRQA